MMRFLFLVLALLVWAGEGLNAAIRLSDDGYHVYPGDEIQDALQLAASNRTQKIVRVHEGEYRPSSKRQALIWLNKMHDGIRLEAEGNVTLTAANPLLSLPAEPSFPAVVNHVVYFGDGITSNTIFKGFRLTGANGFVTKGQTRQLEPNGAILKNYFFYSDGGGVKVFGRSYPRLQNLEIVDNYTSPCGAGISVQHQGFNQDRVSIENCVFLRNRAQGTGSALDLLAGSAAHVVNCLFVGNVSNTGEDPVAKASGEQPFVNSGVMTIFWKSHATVRNCTFTGNRNGVDDMGGASQFLNCIFVDNRLDAGLKGYGRYELAVNAGGSVSGCLLNGAIHDVNGVVSRGDNITNAPPPLFNSAYVPEAPEYQKAGYRPLTAGNNPVPSKP